MNEQIGGAIELRKARCLRAGRSQVTAPVSRRNVSTAVRCKPSPATSK
jgi:hypothetical protein